MLNHYLFLVGWASGLGHKMASTGRQVSAGHVRRLGTKLSKLSPTKYLQISTNIYNIYKYLLRCLCSSCLCSTQHCQTRALSTSPVTQWISGGFMADKIKCLDTYLLKEETLSTNVSKTEHWIKLYLKLSFLMLKKFLQGTTQAVYFLWS